MLNTRSNASYSSSYILPAYYLSSVQHAKGYSFIDFVSILLVVCLVIDYFSECHSTCRTHHLGPRIGRVCTEISVSSQAICMKIHESNYCSSKPCGNAIIMPSMLPQHEDSDLLLSFHDLCPSPVNCQRFIASNHRPYNIHRLLNIMHWMALPCCITENLACLLSDRIHHNLHLRPEHWLWFLLRTGKFLCFAQVSYFCIRNYYIHIRLYRPVSIISLSVSSPATSFNEARCQDSRPIVTRKQPYDHRTSQNTLNGDSAENRSLFLDRSTSPLRAHRLVTLL